MLFVQSMPEAAGAVAAAAVADRLLGAKERRQLAIVLVSFNHMVREEGRSKLRPNVETKWQLRLIFCPSVDRLDVSLTKPYSREILVRMVCESCESLMLIVMVLPVDKLAVFNGLEELYEFLVTPGWVTSTWKNIYRSKAH